MTPPKKILILGDTELVKEYSAACRGAGHAVEVRHRPPASGEAAGQAMGADLALELTNTSAGRKRENLSWLDQCLPPPVPIFSSSVTVTVADQSAWIRNPGRLIGLGALPSLLEGTLLEFAEAPSTAEATREAAKDFARSLSKEWSVVRDSIGMVMPRILCMLANEAFFALMESVATDADIDTAMKLGTNYPAGPFERARRIGLAQVRAVLAALHHHYGEERYRIAPLLHRAAVANQL